MTFARALSIPACWCLLCTAHVTSASSQADVTAGSVDGQILLLELQAARSVDQAETWARLGSAHLQRLRETADPEALERADACASKAVQVDPQNATARKLLVQLRLTQHRFEEALSTAETLLRDFPGDAAIALSAADICIERSQFDRADSLASIAFRLGAGSHLVEARRARTWAGRGRPDLQLQSLRAAEQSANKAVDLGPEHRAWYQLMLGSWFFDAGMPDSAKHYYDVASECFADYPPLLEHLAEWHSVHGDRARALRLYERAYQISGGPVYAHFLVNELRRSGLPDKADSLASVAFASFEKLLLSSSRSAWLRSALKFGLELELDPNLLVLWAAEEANHRPDVESRLLLACARLRVGPHAEASSEADRLCELASRDPQLQPWCEMLQGRRPAEDSN